MVKPLLFFQFEMQGGIIHSFCSAAVALRGGLRRTGGGGLGGPRGIFFVFEARGLQGIFHHLRHLDYPLLQRAVAALLPGGVPDERCLPLAVGHIFWLRGFDFAGDELLQRHARLLRRRLHLFLRGALHGLLPILKVFPMCERDEILELRLDGLALALSLERNGVVPHIPFAVDLQCECVPR